MDVQISAYIADTTKERLDRHARAHGVAKGHLIEQALLHHMQALDELPADAVVAPRMVLDAESAARVQALLADPPAPTPAMRKLFDDR
jgi:uncharacterized protein (DUF1778 family)